MKKNVLFTITFLLLVICFSFISCKEKSKFKVYFCEYDQDQHTDSIYFSKWIFDKNDALKAKLIFNDSILDKRNLDSLYQETAQFLFVVGGGGIFVVPQDCKPEIKNDTLLINYDIRVGGEHGELASSRLCVEISKKKYPNYKNLKVVLHRN